MKQTFFFFFFLFLVLCLLLVIFLLVLSFLSILLRNPCCKISLHQEMIRKMSFFKKHFWETFHALKLQPYWTKGKLILLPNSRSSKCEHGGLLGGGDFCLKKFTWVQRVGSIPPPPPKWKYLFWNKNKKHVWKDLPYFFFEEKLQ